MPQSSPSLRALREKVQLSQKQLAKQTGIPQPKISVLENYGINRGIAHDKLANLLRIVGYTGTVQEFLDGQNS